MGGIDKALLEEVEDCIRRVADFHEANGRAIAKHTRKGRAELEELAQFGLPLPEDLRALYWNHNGTAQGVSIPISAAGVFLEFRWLPTRTLVGKNKIIRAQSRLPREDRLHFSSGVRAVSLDLAPNNSVGGKTPLITNLGSLSHKTFHAFDSILTMLRSVCAAQDAGILRFGSDTVRYDFAEFRDVARAHNTNTEYWDLMAAGTLDWEEITYDFSNSQHGITPEVARIITEPIKRTIGGYSRAHFDKGKRRARWVGGPLLNQAGEPILKNKTVGEVKGFVDGETITFEAESPNGALFSENMPLMWFKPAR